MALPNEADVIQGVKAAKAAAYIGDTAKQPERFRPRDMAMSKARRDSDWDKQFDLALFPDDARAIRSGRAPEDKQACTMCGRFCANQGSANLFGHLLSGTAKA